MDINKNDLIIFGLFDEDVLLNNNIYEELSFGNQKNKLNYPDVPIKVYFYPIDLNYNLIENIELPIRKINDENFINGYEMGFDLSNIDFKNYDQLLLGFIVNKNYYNVNFYFHIKCNDKIIFKKKYNILLDGEINFYCRIMKNNNFIEKIEEVKENIQEKFEDSENDKLYLIEKTNNLNINNNEELINIFDYKWFIFDIEDSFFN